MWRFRTPLSSARWCAVSPSYYHSLARLTRGSFCLMYLTLSDTNKIPEQYDAGAGADSSHPNLQVTVLRTRARPQRRTFTRRKPPLTALPCDLRSWRDPTALRHRLTILGEGATGKCAARARKSSIFASCIGRSARSHGIKWRDAHTATLWGLTRHLTSKSTKTIDNGGFLELAAHIQRTTARAAAQPMFVTKRSSARISRAV